MKDNLIEIGKLDIKIIDGDRGENYPTKEDFFENEYCLFLDAKNITSTGFNLSTTQFITQKKDNELRNGKLKRNDIVMMTRGSVGNVALFDEKIPFENIRINSGMIIIRCEGKYSSKLLYYLLKSSFVKKQINDMMSGSVQKHLTSSSIKQIKILKNYTSIKIDTIYAIDSKIQLNNKINSELEAMAKTIYDYWFLQFEFPNKEGKPYKSSGGKMVWNDELKREIPEGWEVKNLIDYCYLKNGINYNKEETVGEKYKIINVRDISSSSLFVNSNLLDEICISPNIADKYLVNKNDILIARSGSPGQVRIVSIKENMIFSGFIIKCEVKESKYKEYFIYVLKKIENLISTKSNGSILKNINQESLNMLKIVIPNMEIIDNFNRKIVSIHKKIENIMEENQELTSLRDFLLPLLMNGQVGFKEE